MSRRPNLVVGNCYALRLRCGATFGCVFLHGHDKAAGRLTFAKDSAAQPILVRHDDIEHIQDQEY